MDLLVWPTGAGKLAVGVSPWPAEIGKVKPGGEVLLCPYSAPFTYHNAWWKPPAQTVLASSLPRMVTYTTSLVRSAPSPAGYRIVGSRITSRLRITASVTFRGP